MTVQPPYPPPAPQGTYEFSEAENVVFRETASLMRRVALAQMASLVVGAVGVAVTVSRMRGASTQLGGAVGGAGALIVSAVFAGFIAYFLGSSAAAFGRVADTRGDDVANLVTALSAQRSYFGMLKWLTIAAIVLIALACVAGIALAASFAGR